MNEWVNNNNNIVINSNDDISRQVCVYQRVTDLLYVVEVKQFVQQVVQREVRMIRGGEQFVHWLRFHHSFIVSAANHRTLS